MKNRLFKLSLSALFALALAPFIAHAQSYSIDRYVISGGGGTSSGGQFALSGTIGQTDTIRLSGGNYSIDGGYWGMFAVVQSPGAPTLRIQLTSSNTILVAWPAPSTGFSLQQNSVLGTTNWVNVPNSVNPVGGENQVVIAPFSGNNFYRLVSP